MSSPPVEQPPAEQPNEGSLLDLEEKRLKCEKLRAEIERERLPWWRQPGYLASLTPMTLAMVGLLSAWGTGFFDRQRQALDAESKALRTEKDALVSQKAGLEVDIADLKNSRKSLEDQVQAATSTRDELKLENKTIRRQLDDAYVRVNGTAGSVTYLLGHITARPLSKEERKRLSKVVAMLPKQDSEPLQGLLQDIDLAYDLIPDAIKELAQFPKLLEVAPISSWAKKVKWEPGPGNQLHHPDGTPYRSDDPQPDQHDPPPKTKPAPK